MSALSETVDPQLEGVPETLLIPLWARAQEQKRTDPIIIDPDAARIVESLDYDFDRFRIKGVETENFCVRSLVMDNLIRRILSASPNRTVIEFGPGLDTRFHRLGHLAKHWVEVDLLEVVQLRKRFFTPDPTRTVIACSMLDDQWIGEVGDSLDTPPLFIAEGVFYFYSHQQIREFLCRLKVRYPGASLVFDAVSPLYLKLSNLRHPLRTSRLQFSLRPFAAELSEWDAEMRVKDYIGYGDAPAYDGVMHRFAWWKRLAVSVIPSARHSFMIVHAGFNNPSAGA